MYKRALTGLVGVLALTSASHATECIINTLPGAVPAARLLVVEDDAQAQSTFCGGTAGYTSETLLVSDDGDIAVGTGHVTPLGTEFDLGSFLAGDELVFYINVLNTGYTYYTGPGSRNPDGIVHAAVTEVEPGVFHVGFEDLLGGGDLDYDDINLVVEASGVVMSDGDFDEDGMPDEEDNCVAVHNPSQLDADGNGIGDLCQQDLCAPAENSSDMDHDGIADACDEDIDGDGVLDADDACITAVVGGVVNVQGCSVEQLCPCNGVSGEGWKNHGAYVSCVAHQAQKFAKSGRVARKEKGVLVSAAGRSSCGK